MAESTSYLEVYAVPMSEQHIVEFTETSYGLQHPQACRPNLLDCDYHLYLQDTIEPEQLPGRYTMQINQDTEAVDIPYVEYRVAEDTE